MATPWMPIERWDALTCSLHVREPYELGNDDLATFFDDLIGWQ